MIFGVGRRRRRRRTSFVKRERNRRSSLLLVDTARSGVLSRYMYGIGTGILCLIAIAGVVALIGYGVLQARDLLLARNKLFTIQKLEVRAHGTLITDSLVRAYLPVNVGTNLFAVRIGDLQKEFMERAPYVRRMRVSRHLPDTLRVEVWERNPIAWIDHGEMLYLAIDREGYPFRYPIPSKRLPKIFGAEAGTIGTGRLVDGIMLDALAMIQQCEHESLAPVIRVRSVSIAQAQAERAASIHMQLTTGELVDLWWHREKIDGRTPEEDLRGRLEFLKDTILRTNNTGNRIGRANVTFDNIAMSTITLREG